jgi:hypothetical protein
LILKAAEFAVAIDEGDYETPVNIVWSLMTGVAKGRLAKDTPTITAFLGCHGIILGCMACRKGGSGKVLKCMKCRCVVYCSRECQVLHWTDGHKAVCKDCKEEPRFLPNDMVMHVAMEANRVLTDLASMMTSYVGCRTNEAEQGQLLARLTELLAKKSELVQKMQEGRSSFSYNIDFTV